MLVGNADGRGIDAILYRYVFQHTPRDSADLLIAGNRNGGFGAAIDDFQRL